jgi:hypothetical protein
MKKFITLYFDYIKVIVFGLLTFFMSAVFFHTPSWLVPLLELVAGITLALILFPSFRNWLLGLAPHKASSASKNASKA